MMEYWESGRPTARASRGQRLLARFRDDRAVIFSSSAELPASVPFVGPEALGRARGRSFRARLGANESAFRPFAGRGRGDA